MMKDGLGGLNGHYSKTDIAAEGRRRIVRANQIYSRSIVLCQCLGPKSRRKINIDQLSTLLAEINVRENYIGYDEDLFARLDEFEVRYSFIDQMFERLRKSHRA